MGSEKVKVSQNVGQISRVSKSFFFFWRGSERLAVSNFFAKTMWESRSRNPKTSESLSLGTEKNAALAISRSFEFTLDFPSKRIPPQLYVLSQHPGASHDKH